MASFAGQAIPLAAFSEWTKSSGIEEIEIVAIERWKYLSRRAFWHEFLVFQFQPIHGTVPSPPKGLSLNLA